MRPLWRSDMAISMKSLPLFLTVAALSANIVDFPKQEYAAPLKQEIVKEKQKDPSFAYFSYSPMVYAVLPLATVGSALSFGWYDSGKTGAAVTGISAGLNNTCIHGTPRHRIPQIRWPFCL